MLRKLTRLSPLLLALLAFEARAADDAGTGPKHVRGLRLETAWFSERSGRHRTSQLTGGGLFWLFDGRSFQAEVAIDYAFGSGERLLGTGVSAYLPLRRSGLVVPYVGGGVEAALFQAPESSGIGMGLRTAAGLQVGRNPRLRFRVEAGYRRSLLTLTSNGDRRALQGPFLTLGIGF